MSLNHAQGFPSVSYRPDGGLEIADKIYGTYSEMGSAPEIGDDYGGAFQNCYCIKKTNLQPSEGGATTSDQIWTVDLLYGEDSPAYQFSVEQSPLEKPVELATTNLCKTAFLWNWRYHLAAKHGESSVPSWWSTATVSDLISDADAQKYRWISAEAELPVDPTDRTPWYILKRRTKPGVESFVMGNTVVKAQAWYALKENYDDALEVWTQQGAICVKPSNGCGLPTSNARNWLLLPEKSAGRDGYYWTIIVKFMYSPEPWDSDLYA